MDNIRVLYISIEGNTRYFMEHLIAYANQQHEADANAPLVEAVEISDASELTNETRPFFADVPTYLEGGTGIEPEVGEIFTNALGDYIDYQDNRRFLRGVIGSGNKNFNVQYVLTAKRYAEKYQVPLLADYELRGLQNDVERIYGILAEANQAAFSENN